MIHPFSTLRSPRSSAPTGAGPHFGRAFFPGRNNRSLPRLLLFLCAVAAFAGENLIGAPEPPPAANPANTDPGLDAFQAQYAQNVTALTASQEAKSARVRTSYIMLLDRLQKDVSARGDLDGALAIRAERERIVAGQEPNADQRKAMPLALAADRARYEQELQPILADAARQEDALRKRYTVALQDLQKRYTQRNELEKALAVKNALAALAAQNSAGIAASPTGTTPLGASSTTGRQLLSKENEHKWKRTKGEWKIRNDAMTGSGASETNFIEEVSPPFTLQFTIKVLDGMRPRIRLGPTTCGNEGYETTLALFPGDGKSFHYERNTAYKVTLKVTHENVELYVDDNLISTGPGIKDPLDKLGFSAGDDWSKGRVEYRDIALMK